jgi:hypothetical protein
MLADRAANRIFLLIIHRIAIHQRRTLPLAIRQGRDGGGHALGVGITHIAHGAEHGALAVARNTVLKQ